MTGLLRNMYNSHWDKRGVLTQQELLWDDTVPCPLTGVEYIGITDVYLTGLATDYCVFYSALDSINCGFKTYLILDATKGVDLPNNNLSNSLKMMDEKGVNKITSYEL